MAAMPAVNPGVFVVFTSPVIYSDVVPALTVMVVLRSWYPSITRVIECGPSLSMGIVVGVTPIIVPSTYTSAPAGVVVRESEP
jgi:hypothetical protein